MSLFEQRGDPLEVSLHFGGLLLHRPLTDGGGLLMKVVSLTSDQQGRQYLILECLLLESAKSPGCLNGK